MLWSRHSCQMWELRYTLQSQHLRHFTSHGPLVQDGQSMLTLHQHLMLQLLICLGCNKDLWSWRSKYKSYGALRVQSGGKRLSPGVV